MILKTNVTKEDFKRAYTECLKSAWILHNQENFNQAVSWKKKQLFTYHLKQKSVEEEDDFDSNASSIDIFEVFSEVYENDPEKLAEWNARWANEQGFDLVEYEGDSIIDGNTVGDLARQYFIYLMEKDNLQTETNFESFSFEHYSFKDALKETNKLLKSNKEARFLFEAAFEYDNANLKTRCDVLELLGNNHVNLYEVKATSKIKTEHFYDVVYQIYILQKNGFIVDNVAVVTLNADYIYGMNQDIELKKQANNLFEKTPTLTYQEVIDDISTNNLLTPFTNDSDEEIDLMRVLKLNYIFKTKKGTKKNPEDQELTFIESYRILDQTIGVNLLISQLAKYLNFTDQSAINLMKKQECETPVDFSWNAAEQKFFFKNGKKPVWCHHVMPWFDESRQTIFNLTGLWGTNKAEIFYQTNYLYFDDIPNLESIDLEQKFDEKLYRVFNVYKQQRLGDLKAKDILNINHFGELKQIYNNFFNHEQIYMYDFETAKWALPKFKYSNAYQQIPFQYSVDIIYDQNYDYHQPESMHHHHFISSKTSDPRPDFIVNLINDLIIKHGYGVYVAYNKSFEIGVLKKLAFEFPKYAKSLLYIAQNTIDLMDFFKGKKTEAEKGVEGRSWFLIYHPDFFGSYSIKKTQPALDSSLNYHDLIINKGDKASQTFRQYVDGKIKSDVWNNDIEPKMVLYCNRDTLAMVVILKQVGNLLKSYESEVQHG